MPVLHKKKKHLKPPVPPGILTPRYSTQPDLRLENPRSQVVGNGISGAHQQYEKVPLKRMEKPRHTGGFFLSFVLVSFSKAKPKHIDPTPPPSSKLKSIIEARLLIVDTKRCRLKRSDQRMFPKFSNDPLILVEEL